MSSSRLSSFVSGRILALLAAGVTGGSTITGCGMANAVVGGACADGFVLCGDVCVDAQSDQDNCGACGNVCASTLTCSAGQCSIGGPLGPQGPEGQGSGASSNEAGASGPVGSSSDAGTTVAQDGASSVAQDGASSVAQDGGSTGPGQRADAGTSTTPDDAGAVGTSTGADDAGPTGASGAGPSGGADDAGNDTTTSSDDAGNDAALSSDDAATSANDAGANDNDSSPGDASSDDAAPLCVSPLVSCSSGCADLQDDAFNCGACGHFCPTYICQAGACVGSYPGQVVLVGHDYSAAIPEATPQARILVNSIFGSGSPTVRVLAYEQYAAPQAVANVASLLNAYAQATHRQIAFTSSVDALAIPGMLDVTDFDALLVFDEANAPPGVLGAIGSNWASSVNAYATAGGTVVVLDGATAPEMPTLVTNAGMFALSAQTSLPQNSQVLNVAPGDSIGSGVESPYSPTQNSAYFTVNTNSPGITTVVFDQTDLAPVVLQRVF